MNIVEVRISRAGYKERNEAIQQIQFHIQPGELVGLIGPNGAGKSTTIKAMMGLLKDFEGEITMSRPDSKYAYIPEQPIFYDELTLWEHIELVATLFEMERNFFEVRAEQLLERFKLREEKHHLPPSFSKGMQQKLMIILAFLIQPDLYIVDEPFVGLDPTATKVFLELLSQERQRGAGILMSTHVLDTAEKICERFVLLNGGRIIAQGNLAEIQKQCGLESSSLLECFNHLVEILK